jgi:hypothetical protein
MTMANSYIPPRESEMDNWLNNFKTLIAASPTSYSLVASDATAITNAYNAWHSAYLLAINPTTRTKATVATKNTQKGIVLGVVRGYADTIRVNVAVSDALKIGLGLRVRDTVPTPVPPPATFPLLTITEPMRGMQDVRAADELTPNKRARPTGSAGLLLFRAVATEAVPSPDDARFLSFVTRSEFQSNFDPADNGKTATYFARWTNAKGEVGPWSAPVSMPIAA